MKKVKGLSVVMSALLAAQGGISSAVFATKPQKEMEQKIQNQFLQTIFFRPDLVGVLKTSLKAMKEEDIPKFFRTPEFLNLLKEKGVLKDESEGGKKEEVETEEKLEKENREKKPNLREIIEEDNLEELQKEFEQNPNTEIEDSFFEVKNMKIPILHYCVMKKAMKCFKFLILNGADPTAKLGGYSAYKDWDCMSLAICIGEWEMMKILEERGMNKLNNPTVWEAAALTHRNNLLKLFISDKDEIVNFDKCLQAGMKGVAKGNNLKGLKLLLNGGADINEKDYGGSTPLHCAIVNDANKVAELLISKGADINAKDMFGSTPLHYAAEKNANKVAEVLISKGADIHAIDCCGWIPLYYAVQNNDLKMVELLMSKGADINVKDYKRKTPLHIAAKKDAIGVAELLISKGADIHAIDCCGSTPLYCAIVNDANKVAELLISKGADINAKDQWGWTPLHIAAWHNAEKVAEVLISKGADINAKDENGRTPLQLYREHRGDSSRIEQLLISQMKEKN